MLNFDFTYAISTVYYASFTILGGSDCDGDNVSVKAKLAIMIYLIKFDGLRVTSLIVYSH